MSLKQLKYRVVLALVPVTTGLLLMLPASAQALPAAKCDVAHALKGSVDTMTGEVIGLEALIIPLVGVAIVMGVLAIFTSWGQRMLGHGLKMALAAVIVIGGLGTILANLIHTAC